MGIGSFRKRKTVLLSCVCALFVGVGVIATQAIGQTAEPQMTLSTTPGTSQRFGENLTVTADFGECVAGGGSMGDHWNNNYGVNFYVAGANNIQSDQITIDYSGVATFSYEGAIPGLDNIVVVLTRRSWDARCWPNQGTSDSVSYEWTGVGATVTDQAGNLVGEGSIVAQLTPDGQGGCDGTSGVEVLSGYYFDANVELVIDGTCRVIVDRILPQPTENYIETDTGATGPDVVGATPGPTP